jgi:hypothetical protein
MAECSVQSRAESLNCPPLWLHWLQDKKSPFAYREEITLQNDDLTTLVWALDTTEIAKEATNSLCHLLQCQHPSHSCSEQPQ